MTELRASMRGPRARGTVAALVLALGLAGCVDGPAAPAIDPALALVSGGDQEGLEGIPLPAPVVLRVVDPAGRPLPDVVVDLEASHGGVVEPGVAVSGSDGRVRTEWTPGPATAPRQELRARAEPSSGILTVGARVLPLEAADRIVVRHAQGPLRGIILVQDGTRSLDVVRQAVAPDTLLVLQPRADHTGLVVFPGPNALEWRDVAWTPGPDTVVVSLRPPAPVDVLVRIFVGPFDRMRAQAQADLARAAEIWADGGFGIRLGSVEVVDRVEPGKVVSATGAGACSSPATERLEVNYVHLVNGQASAGYGCPPGQVFLGAEAGQRYPWLLAHEIGHTFTLTHRTPGMMNPSAPTTGVTDGEVFKANFDEDSGLNLLFQAQPESARRPCLFWTGGSCLDAAWVLGGG